MKAASPLLVAALLLLGCEEDIPPFSVTDVDRCRSESGVDNHWASGPWPGQIDAPQTEGLIEIGPLSGIRLLHDLGRHPAEVHCYVGFSEDPARVMPASGNSCEVHELGIDETTGCHFVLIRNGSGGSFFYRFVLR